MVRALESFPGNAAGRKEKAATGFPNDVMAIRLMRILAHRPVVGPAVNSEQCTTKRKDESERA